MIHALLRRGGDNAEILVLGLTEDDIAQLMSDEAIGFDLAEFGLPPQLVILIGGRDHNAVAATIRTTAHQTIGVREP